MKTNIKSLIIKLIVILSVTIILSSISIKVLANNNFNIDFSSEKTDVDQLVDKGATTVVTVLRIASIAIAIVVLLVIAMKYMISAPGDRADIKKHAVAYVVGTFILFSAMQIIAILVDISNTAFSGTQEGAVSTSGGN